MTEYLTKEELAGRLKCSTKTISRMMADGQVPYMKIGPVKQSRVRFSWPDVEECLRKRYGRAAG
jgi:excisionase family DNA binding protein